MTILSPNQRNFLEISSRNGFVTDNFYLTGGTALAEFYLEFFINYAKGLKQEIIANTPT